MTFHKMMASSKRRGTFEEHIIVANAGRRISLLYGYPVNCSGSRFGYKSTNQLVEFVMEKKLKRRDPFSNGSSELGDSLNLQRGDFFLAIDGNIYFIPFNERLIEHLEIKAQIINQISTVNLQDCCIDEASPNSKVISKAVGCSVISHSARIIDVKGSASTQIIDHFDFRTR